MELSEATLNNGLKIMFKVIDLVKNGKAFDLEEVENFADTLIRELSGKKGGGPYGPQQYKSLRDYPVYHTIDVTILSILMAVRIGRRGSALHEIALGALFHDIGKINTPEEIYWKQDGDNDHEMKILAEHPKFGSHWISSLIALDEPVLKIISEHHERFDGSGYPDRLTDQDISLSSKIVAICNYFAYMVSALPEKPAMDRRVAMFELLRQSGKRFSPKVVNSFLNSMAPVLLDGSLYMPSSAVLLSSGEIATVSSVESPGDISPNVTILTDANRKKLGRPVTINLKKDTSRKIVKILKSN